MHGPTVKFEQRLESMMKKVFASLTESVRAAALMSLSKLVANALSLNAAKWV